MIYLSNFTTYYTCKPFGNAANTSTSNRIVSNRKIRQSELFYQDFCLLSFEMLLSTRFTGQKLKKLQFG